MRRLVLLILLAVLPVQWSWAAAASICQHETSITAAHPGHHAHEHTATPAASLADEAPNAAAAGPDGLDADCGVCHASCSSALMAAAAPLAVPQAALPAFATFEATVPKRFVDTPVRPPRFPAV